MQNIALQVDIIRVNASQNHLLSLIFVLEKNGFEFKFKLNQINI